MEKLPSKSLSKFVLISIPLFCFVIAILDTSQELSYLFILQLLENMVGSPDMIFLSAEQPQIGKDYQKQQYFQNQHIQLEKSVHKSPHLPVVSKRIVEQWATKYEIIKGTSPRWVVPTHLNRTESLIIVSNITNELNLGIGVKSNLQNLGDKQIALSRQTLTQLSKRVGDKINITFKIGDLFKGKKTVEKFQDFMSQKQSLFEVESAFEMNLVAYFLYSLIAGKTASKKISTSQKQMKEMVKYIKDIDFRLEYTIKYQYINSGLFPQSLNNIILMEFGGFSRLLVSLINQNIFKFKQRKQELFQFLNKTPLSSSEIQTIKTHLQRVEHKQYQQHIQRQVNQHIQKHPLLMVAVYNHRELVYHPDEMQKVRMHAALENTPREYQVVSIYPFFEQLSSMRYFFNSIILIVTFVCIIAFFYIMRLIIKHIYEQKEIEIGIWRILGAGGARQRQQDECSQNAPFMRKKLNVELSFTQKLSQGYDILVKIGFVFEWIFCCLASVALYQLIKIVLYQKISMFFQIEAPPHYIFKPILWFISIFGFIMTLVILHISKIYMNPLATTIKPLKRTFDLVKVRVIKIATFGITSEIFILSLVLIYYGVVSYYWIPRSILENQKNVVSLLFGSIFMLMIVGAIMLLIVMQYRMECWVLQFLFYFSKYLSTLKLIMLTSIKAKNYKNFKVSLIVSLIFAILLFFITGICIEIKIVKSFSEQKIGADLMILNNDIFLNRSRIEQYLNTTKGVKYTWIGKPLQSDQLFFGFQSISKKQQVSSYIQILESNYLDVAYYQYYYSEQYDRKTINQLLTLPNGIKNGFSSIYLEDERPFHTKSKLFNRSGQNISFDPWKINIPSNGSLSKNALKIPEMQKQIIYFVVSNTVRKKIEGHAGDELRLLVRNVKTSKNFYFKCVISHSFKLAPTLDINSDYAFISKKQASYIYSVANVSFADMKYHKLLLKTSANDMQQIGNRILGLSPDNTEIININQVRYAFSFVENYLNDFFIFTTVVLGMLSVLFLSVYTFSKCRQQAELFKELRSIGLSVFDIRFMIYLEIFVRIVISVVNGIILGAIFSAAIVQYVKEMVMVQVQMPKLDILLLIAFILLLFFSITVIKATEYLTKLTVLQTSKI